MYIFKLVFPIIGIVWPREGTPNMVSKSNHGERTLPLLEWIQIFKKISGVVATIKKKFGEWQIKHNKSKGDVDIP